MLVVAAGAGPGMVTAKVSGPDNFVLERSYPLEVRPATQILTRRSVRTLAKGETLTLSKDLFADFVPGTGRAGVSVAVSTSLDAATLLNALDRYPFGCSEQIASRAMAMLYVNELAAQARWSRMVRLISASKMPLPRLLARQGFKWFIRLVDGRRRGSLARCLRHGFPDARTRAWVRYTSGSVHARGRSSAQLRRNRSRAKQKWGPGVGLCALRAGAQRCSADR